MVADSILNQHVHLYEHSHTSDKKKSILALESEIASVLSCISKLFNHFNNHKGFEKKKLQLLKNFASAFWVSLMYILADTGTVKSMYNLSFQLEILLKWNLRTVHTIRLETRFFNVPQSSQNSNRAYGNPSYVQSTYGDQEWCIQIALHLLQTSRLVVGAHEHKSDQLLPRPTGLVHFIPSEKTWKRICQPFLICILLAKEAKHGLSLGTDPLSLIQSTGSSH